MENISLIHLRAIFAAHYTNNDDNKRKTFIENNANSNNNNVVDAYVAFSFGLCALAKAVCRDDVGTTNALCGNLLVHRFL